MGVGAALAALAAPARRACAQPVINVSTGTLTTSVTVTATHVKAGRVSIGSISLSVACPATKTCKVYLHASARPIAATIPQWSYASSAWADVGTPASPALVMTIAASSQAQNINGQVISFSIPTSWQIPAGTYTTSGMQISVSAI